MSLDKDNDKTFNSLTNYFGLLWAVCLVTPLALGLWMLLTAGSMPDDVQGWGVFGDFVGGISNPFISAFTFLALIFTIIQNQKVLRINEQELEETRKEIALTREANEKQAEEFKLQNEMIRRDSTSQALSQALTQLFEEIRSASQTQVASGGAIADWLEHPKDRIIKRFDNNELALQQTYEKILDFTPLTASYIRLLIKFKQVDPDNPMLYSAASIAYVLIEKMVRNDYLGENLSDKEMAELKDILSEVE